MCYNYEQVVPPSEGGIKQWRTDMKKYYMEACMNATRQRIMQVIMIKKEATSAEIGEELPDIPRASLYRHIKVLLDA